MVIYKISNGYSDDYKNHQVLKKLFPGQGKLLYQRNGSKLTILTDLEPIENNDLIKLDSLDSIIEEKENKINLFSLRMNSCKRHKGKRIPTNPELFVNKQLAKSGMNVLSSNIIDEGLLISVRKNQRCYHASVLVNGMMKIEDKDTFKRVIVQGLGHGKAFGFGLINIFF